MFAPGSRYEQVPNGTFTDAKGRQIAYKLMRVISTGPALQTHTVQEGERLDVIAFNAYRDAEQFWRICDSNRALRPEELVTPAGRRLLIPLPQR